MSRSQTPIGRGWLRALLMLAVEIGIGIASEVALLIHIPTADPDPDNEACAPDGSLT